MLNIDEQLGIRNARRNGLRPYRTRNNSRGSSAEETAAGQCRRLAGHGPVSITGGDQSRGLWLALSGDYTHDSGLVGSGFWRNHGPSDVENRQVVAELQ
jgi:hypothetical protein